MRHGLAMCLVGFAMLAPEEAIGHDALSLFVEPMVPLPAGVASVLESALRENPDYKYCVRLGQLGPAQVARTRIEGT